MKKNILMSLIICLSILLALAGKAGCIGAGEENLPGSNSDMAVKNSGIIDVTAYGAVGDGKTNDAPAIQNAIAAAIERNGATLYFPRGVYRITSDITYTLSRANGVLNLTGDGIFGNNYDELNSGGSVLFFDGANFKDGMAGDWNTAKGVSLNIENMGLVFNGSGGKGYWKAPLTLPTLENVAIKIKGSYADHSVVLFGSAPGPVGKTASFKNVTFFPAWHSGNYVTGMQLHFDTFTWDGGGIGTHFGSVVEPRLVFIDSVFASEVNKINFFRDDAVAITFFLLNITEKQSVIRFRDCYFEGAVKEHFSAGCECPVVLENCNFNSPLKINKNVKIKNDLLWCEADLPAADAGNRGRMIMVRGGNGVADKIFVCIKLADNTYSWVQIA